MKKTLLWMTVMMQLVMLLLGGCSRDEAPSVDNSAASSMVTSGINNKTTAVHESIDLSSVSDKIMGETEESSIDNSKTNTPTTSLTDMTQKTTGTTTTATGTAMPPWKYSIQRVPTVDDLLKWVKITDVKDYDGQYGTFLTRVRERGVCVPLYKGKRLDSENFERGVSLIFEMEAEAPGFFYYYPGGIVRCYYTEDGLTDKAKEQLVSFRNGKNSRAAAKEADELDAKTENLVLSDNRKVVCASYQDDDRRMATFLLAEDILITVDVFNRCELSQKEVIKDLSFEIIDV